MCAALQLTPSALLLRYEDAIQGETGGRGGPPSGICEQRVGGGGRAGQRGEKRRHTLVARVFALAGVLGGGIATAATAVELVFMCFSEGRAGVMNGAGACVLLYVGWMVSLPSFVGPLFRVCDACCVVPLRLFGGGARCRCARAGTHGWMSMRRVLVLCSPPARATLTRPWDDVPGLTVSGCIRGWTCRRFLA